MEFLEIQHNTPVLILVFVLLSIFGSFAAALTYRLPRKISILKGRSACPRCKKQINWYDNIPLISFFLLGGRCRWCKKKISWRYPLIEFFSLLIGGFLIYLNAGEVDVNLLFTLVIGLVMLCIFVVDLEHRIIPDEFIWFGIVLSLIYLVLAKDVAIYLPLLTAQLAALFLLMIFFLTHGRGMGLGDVKLCLLIGMLFSPAMTVLWMLSSFIIGGVVGLMMIIFKLARFSDKIAFGPFLVVSYFVTLAIGQSLIPIIFPW